MTREELITALADYFHINEDTRSFEWQGGCTIPGEDGEYRWLTLVNVIEALEDYLDEDWD